ncbi:hypothetical protein BC940DRAFT_301154 [Gongronella butleri]|nr:hypothetical protein BC940DRAFT_301154 [Gongronella butleri]
MTSTSVKVALRVRPLTDREQGAHATESLLCVPNEPHVLLGNSKAFTFDHVFSSSIDQTSVYELAIAPLLANFLEGYNATVLAYGQTGSGKTYSMGTTMDQTRESQGIIPRCASKLFELLHLQAAKDPAYDFEVYISFLELHNEDLIDLLSASPTPKRRSMNGTAAAAGGGAASGATDVTIREDPAGNIYWSGVKEERCFCPEDLLRWLEQGSLCRTTASTDMNKVSSRSHALFTLQLKQKKKPRADEAASCLTSKFHFVDLAGSERLKRTHAEGDRAKEGIAINAGLLALGNVISALADENRRRHGHVPYRDSKLTRLLQDSLGGNSQTLMLACVSPAGSDAGETLNTLRYASRARNIKNQVAINHEILGDAQVDELKAMVARLQGEIAAMRASSASLSHTMTSFDMAMPPMAAPLQQEILRLRDRLQLAMDTLENVYKERDSLLLDRLASQKIQNAAMDLYADKHDEDTRVADLVDTHPILDKHMETMALLHKDLDKAKDRLTTLQTSMSTFVPASSTRTTATTTATASTVTVRGPRPPRHMMPQAIGPILVDDDEGYEHQQEDNAALADEIKDSIARAKDDIQKGLAFLQQIKPVSLDEDAIDVASYPIERSDSDEGIFSLPSSPCFDTDDLAKMDQPWGMTGFDHGDEEEEDAGMNSQRSSWCTVSSQGSSVGGEGSSHPMWMQALQQIQSDIKVKEALVDQLEKTDAEYKQMRRQFEAKIHAMQDQLGQWQQQQQQQQRQQTSNNNNNNNNKKKGHGNQQVRMAAEIKQQYEAKTKRLMAELQELKRKYAQTSHAMQSKRNQHESMIKSLKVNMERLKQEKHKMTFRMAAESSRVREQSLAQQRKIQQLQRQHHEASAARKRLEQHQLHQKQALKRCSDDLTLHSSQLKQLTCVMRKAVREGGMLDERLLGKISHIIGGHFAVMAHKDCAGFPLPGGGHSRRKKPTHHQTKRKTSHAPHPAMHAPSISSSTMHSSSVIPLQVRSCRKKKLLDAAVQQYVNGRALLESMEQLLVRREQLADEKQDLMDERRQVYLQEKARAPSGQPMATDALDALDARIDALSGDMTRLTNEIHAVQAKAAAMQQQLAQQEQKKRASPLNGKRRVTFADEIITEPLDVIRQQQEQAAWAALDAFERKHEVPANADPDCAYRVSVHLIKTLPVDECKQIMQLVMEDLLALRVAEERHLGTIHHLETTIANLHQSIHAMKQAKNDADRHRDDQFRRAMQQTKKNKWTDNDASWLCLDDDDEQELEEKDNVFDDDDDDMDALLMLAATSALSPPPPPAPPMSPVTHAKDVDACLMHNHELPPRQAPCFYASSTPPQSPKHLIVPSSSSSSSLFSSPLFPQGINVKRTDNDMLKQMLTTNPLENTNYHDMPAKDTSSTTSMIHSDHIRTNV